MIKWFLTWKTEIGEGENRADLITLLKNLVMSFLQTNLSPLIKNINQGKVVCPRQMAKQSKTILLRILKLNHWDHWISYIYVEHLMLSYLIKMW